MKLLPIPSCRYCYFQSGRKTYIDNSNRTTTEPSQWAINCHCSKIGMDVTIQVYKETIHPCCNLEEGESR